jgi:Spy/CpxP family protein refolding chaperone
MRYWILIALALAFSPLRASLAEVQSGKGAGYQPPGYHHRKVDTLDDRVNRMGARLGLTEPQKAAVKTILERGQAMGKGVWTDPKLSGAERILAFRNIDRQITVQISAVLTPEQRKKYGLPDKEPPPTKLVPGTKLPGLN